MTTEEQREVDKLIGSSVTLVAANERLRRAAEEQAKIMEGLALLVDARTRELATAKTLARSWNPYRIWWS
jgi:hypothetical protein